MTTSRRNLLVTMATQPFVSIIGDHSAAVALSGYRGGLISLAFDDGWRSQYTNALPILQNADLKSTFYVISGKIAYGWRDGYMDAHQIIDIYNHGHEIGGHTITHPDLTQLSEVEAATEISKDKSDLEALISTEVRSFAYPYGAYNDAVVKIVKRAGYKSARAGDTGFNTASTNPYRLLAIGPTKDTPLESLKLHIGQAQETALWLIIVFHHIDDSGNMYSKTPHFFEQVVSYIKRKKVRTVTVSEGLRESVDLSGGI